MIVIYDRNSFIKQVTGKAASLHLLKIIDKHSSLLLTTVNEKEKELQLK